MSLLSELNTIAESCGVPVETGIFSDAAPDTYHPETQGAQRRGLF